MLDIFQYGILKGGQSLFLIFWVWGGGGGDEWGEGVEWGNTQNQVIPLICIFIILSMFI